MGIKLLPALWRARFALTNISRAASRSALVICLLLSGLCLLLAQISIPSLSPETLFAIRGYERDLGLILANKNYATRSGALSAGASFLLALGFYHLFLVLTPGTVVLKPGDNLFLVMLRRLCHAAAFALATLPFVPVAERFAFAQLEAILGANLCMLLTGFLWARHFSNVFSSKLISARLRSFIISHHRSIYLFFSAIFFISVALSFAFLSPSARPLPLPMSAHAIANLPLPEFIYSRLLFIDQSWASIALLIWSFPIGFGLLVAPVYGFCALFIWLSIILVLDRCIDFKKQVALIDPHSQKNPASPLFQRFLSLINYFAKRALSGLMNAISVCVATFHAVAARLSSHTQSLRSESLSLTPAQLAIMEAKRLGADTASKASPSVQAKPRL